MERSDSAMMEKCYLAKIDSVSCIIEVYSCMRQALRKFACQFFHLLEILGLWNISSRHRVGLYNIQMIKVCIEEIKFHISTLSFSRHEQSFHNAIEAEKF